MMRKMKKGRGCACIDCMYGGSIGSEHGGIAPPSSEKGDDEMSEVDPRDFMPLGEMAFWDRGAKDPENGNAYVLPEDIKRAVGGGGCAYGIRIDAKLSYTAYVVKSGPKERYAKTKEKALQIASEMLDCDGKVEIKRIELS